MVGRRLQGENSSSGKRLGLEKEEARNGGSDSIGEDGSDGPRFHKASLGGLQAR